MTRSGLVDRSRDLACLYRRRRLPTQLLRMIVGPDRVLTQGVRLTASPSGPVVLPQPGGEIARRTRPPGNPDHQPADVPHQQRTVRRWWSPDRARNQSLIRHALPATIRKLPNLDAAANAANPESGFLANPCHGRQSPSWRKQRTESPAANWPGEVAELTKPEGFTSHSARGCEILSADRRHGTKVPSSDRYDPAGYLLRVGNQSDSRQMRW